MTKIKICGLRRLEDVRIVNRYKPDLVGFIFDPTRKRYVDKIKAAEIRSKLKFGIKAVGVFVDADISTEINFVKEKIIDVIQLHGSESEEFIQELKKKLNQVEMNVSVIKAFSIKSHEDIERAARSPADMILLDAGKGGSGETFDWKLLKKIQRPYFLAGGINTDNIDEALLHKPYGVDIASGSETDGKKDEKKIKELIRRVRNE